MSTVHAVGIDLGTTYSSIAFLNPQGEPVSIPNADGEPTTPSVVLFEPSGQAVVGVEALRNAIVAPERVVQHAKRWIGDADKKWTIDGRSYTPVDVSALIIRQLLTDAESRIGKVTRAVVTVPAQFSDLQRRDTVRAANWPVWSRSRSSTNRSPRRSAMCSVRRGCGSRNWPKTSGSWYMTSGGDV